MVVTPIAVIVAIFGGKQNRSRGYSLEGLTSMPSPIVDLEVTPVSPGDEIYYSIYCKGEYMSRIKNKNKGKSLLIITESREEMEKKVEEAFKKWAAGNERESESGE